MTSAVVIGAGHNGLITATLLARRGIATTLVEARHDVGGMAAPYEFAPGFWAPGLALFTGALDREVASALSLTPEPAGASQRAVNTLALRENEAPVLLSDAPPGHDPLSSERHRLHDFEQHRQTLATALAAIQRRRPPKLADGTLKDKAALLRTAFELRRLGRHDLRELLRVGASNVYDVLDEWFEHERLKGALALDGVLGTHAGPRSANSMLNYLHGRGGAALQPALSGPRSTVAALMRAAQAQGVKVRTGARVEQVVVHEGRAAGVRLATGEQLDCDVVVSNVDAATLVLKLVGARHFDTGFVRRVSHVRCVGAAARLDLGLSALPDIPGLSAHALGQRLVIAPDPDAVERASNAVKYGAWSEEPVMEISLPSLHDDEAAPAGKHVLSATVQYVPYALNGGWTDNARHQLTEHLVQQLERYLPGVAERVEVQALRTPADIERDYGIKGGHWHHGELALDQFLFVRPTYGAAQYALPLEGLYLCGASAHPGGGVTGLPGWLCANEIIKRTSLS